MCTDVLQVLNWNCQTVHFDVQLNRKTESEIIYASQENQVNQNKTIKTH